MWSAIKLPGLEKLKICRHAFFVYEKVCLHTNHACYYFVDAKVALCNNYAICVILVFMNSYNSYLTVEIFLLSLFTYTKLFC